VYAIGTGKKSKCDGVETTTTNAAKQPTTTKHTTTTTATTTTTSGSPTRTQDVNERRWLQAAMPHSTTERTRSYRPYHTLLNHRPSSTVLDAIRAIEARQLPPSDPAVLPTGQNDEYLSSAVDRRTGFRLVDVVGRLEPAGGSLQAARVMQPLCAGAVCPQGRLRSQDLMCQGHFEGQSGRISN